jgi:Reverse transcriptase (RNA-dependent DNA polymerase)
MEPGGVEGEDDWDALGYEEFVGTIEEFATLTGTELEMLWETWNNTIKAEISKCEKLEMWDIVEAPQDVNIIACHYVFRYKLDANGAITKFKVRIIAKGFTQVYGIDYHETCVWIVRWETLCNLLAAAGVNGSVVHQADAKNAYLKAKIDEDVYMALPPDYEKYILPFLRLIQPSVTLFASSTEAFMARSKADGNGTKSSKPHSCPSDMKCQRPTSPL